jgi:hypothetical protein
VSKDCYLLVYVREEEIKASNVTNPGSADWALKYVEEDEKDARLSRKDFDEFKVRIEIFSSLTLFIAWTVDWIMATSQCSPIL